MKGLLIGLTGGIGSGKSVAAEQFSALGATVIDADMVAHELTGAGGAAIPAIEQHFGREALAADGSLDRAAMRRLVFADPARRLQLESILHPMIRAVCAARQITALEAGVACVVMVVPLLAESDQASRNRFDRIAVVDCPEDLQIQRVMARSRLSAAEVKAIMAAQASRQQRLDIANDIIVNDAGLDALRAQVAALHAKYAAMAVKISANG